MSSAELDALTTGAHHLLASKYFQLAAFVMLVYDHMLTFSQEVDRVWGRRFSWATVLFLLNRYITPLQFIIILDAFHDPRWTKEVCQKFVVFEGASTVVLIAICQMIMILRVYALYHRSLTVLTVMLTLWSAQIITSSIGLHTGSMIHLPPQLTGCIFSGDSPIFPLIWLGPLVTDSTIFGLTLWRTRTYLLDSGKVPTIHIFIRDGSAYFLVIFMANLLNTLLFFLAGEDLKAIGASFSQLITAVMASHIVLNLRSCNSWGGYSETDELSTSADGGRYVGTFSQPLFATGTIVDTDDFVPNHSGDTYTVDVDYLKDRERDPSCEIPMSSLSLRRKLDAISYST